MQRQVPALTRRVFKTDVNIYLEYYRSQSFDGRFLPCFAGGLLKV